MSNALPDLDPLLHSRLRLAVVSVLMNVEEADFTFLRERTGATAGNLTNWRQPATLKFSNSNLPNARAPFVA